MVRRVPSTGSGEFKLGTQVIVRESQTAVFFRDGQSLDKFGPGRHTLSTANLPLIGKRITDRVFGESPFKAEVYFINQNVFPSIKWGTRDPIAYRDKELSLVRLRAHGEMSVRVADPLLFLNRVVGVRGIFNAKDIEGFLKSFVVSNLAQVLGAELTSIFDLPVRYDDLVTATKARVYDEFASYGTELISLVIESITPPEEVQTRIDERSSIGAIGDLNDYLRYKSALAVEEAAGRPGGGGGVMDAAVGLGLGMSVMRTAQEGVAPIPGPGTDSAGPPTVACPSCAHQAPAGSKFCPECGNGLAARECADCHQLVTAGAKFCASCGTPVN
jgi:membrane protease subunit (stomatin/prohibitin family)